MSYQQTRQPTPYDSNPNGPSQISQSSPAKGSYFPSIPINPHLPAVPVLHMEDADLLLATLTKE